MHILGVNVGAPGFERGFHFARPITQHPFKLRAEKYLVGLQIPVPQAIGGFSEGITQLGVSTVQVMLNGQSLADVAGNRQKILLAVVKERPGIDLNRHFSTCLVPVLTDEDKTLCGTNRLRNADPLVHPHHVLLQTQNRMVEHLIARHTQLRQGSSITFKNIGACRINQKHAIRQMVKQRSTKWPWQRRHENPCMWLTSFWMVRLKTTGQHPILPEQLEFSKWHIRQRSPLR